MACSLDRLLYWSRGLALLPVRGTAWRCGGGAWWSPVTGFGLDGPWESRVSGASRRVAGVCCGGDAAAGAAGGVACRRVPAEGRVCSAERSGTVPAAAQRGWIVPEWVGVWSGYAAVPSADDAARGDGRPPGVRPAAFYCQREDQIGQASGWIHPHAPIDPSERATSSRFQTGPASPPCSRRPRLERRWRALQSRSGCRAPAAKSVLGAVGCAGASAVAPSGGCCERSTV